MADGDTFLGVSRDVQLIAIGILGGVLLVVGFSGTGSDTVWPFALGLICLLYPLAAFTSDWLQRTE